MQRLWCLVLTALFVGIPLAVGQGSNLPVCTQETDGIFVSETVIDGNARPTILQMGTDGSVILILSTAGSLFRSSDSGLTYQKNSGFQDRVNTLTGTADPDLAFLYTGYGSDAVQFTEDGGATWVRRIAPGRVNWCDPHPTLANALLCLISMQCRTGIYCTAVYATMNFGRSWIGIANYAYMAMWAYMPDVVTPNPIDSLFLTRTPNETINNFSAYNLYQCTVSNTANCTQNPVILGAFLLLENDDPSHAATYTCTLSPLRLYVSHNRSFTWEAAVMPDEFANPQGTTYVFSGRSGVFLGASSAYRSGTSYVDFYAGDSWFEDFSLSLPYVVRQAHVEWHEVSSLSGVYIANQYDIDAGFPKTTDPVVTKISYDYGGAWHSLEAPADATCIDFKACNLHLASWSELPASPILSPHDVVGYIIGNGNVGAALGPSANMSTFISTDGGATWTNFYPSPTVFEFGDHGGFVVMTPYGTSTTSLIYTWDGGAHKDQCGFSAQGLFVSDIIISDYSDAVFFIYGIRQVNSVPTPVIITVDFGQFHEAVCTAADYEIFVPTGFNNSCELGMHVGYSRRKVSAQCANPADWTSVTSVTGAPCPCSQEDYECDWCYEYVPTSGECAFACDRSQYGQPPPDCKDSWYPYSGGWRLTAGTQCDMNAPGALKLLGSPAPCPVPSSTSTTTAVRATLITAAALTSSTSRAASTSVSAAVASAISTSTSSIEASIAVTSSQLTSSLSASTAAVTATATAVASATVTTTTNKPGTNGPTKAPAEKSSNVGAIIAMLFVVLLILAGAAGVTLYHHNPNFRAKVQDFIYRCQASSSGKKDPFSLPESALDRKRDGADIPLVNAAEGEDA